jgi:hypothetical protein
MEERMLSMYAEMDKKQETEEEFMANHPPTRPVRSQVDLQALTLSIMYRCRMAIGELIACWDMEEEIIRDLDEVVEIRKLLLLLDIWYESSPEGVAWQAWRQDEEKYHAQKMADIAKEDEELEF